MPSVHNRLSGPRARRQWLLLPLGVVFTVAAVGHFAARPGHGDPVLFAATVLPALGMLAYGGWFWEDGPRGVRGDAVLVWAVGAAGLVLALDLWAFMVDGAGPTDAVQHVIIQHTSVGALGGAIAGTYAERDRWRARSRLRLLRALDAAMDGVAVLDDDGTILYANRAFTEAFGASMPAAVVGGNWRESYPEESRERIGSVLADLDDGSRERWQGTVTARRADDTTYPQDLSMTTLDDGYVWVCRDVSGREERDQRLRVLNRVLRHNVRNALNVVLGRASRIGERDGNEADVASIVDAAEDLLATSEKARRVEHALHAGPAATESLDAIVADAVAHASEEYPEREFEVDADAGVSVDARLRLAVRELVENAAQHCDADQPRVRVTATAGDAEGDDAAGGDGTANDSAGGDSTADGSVRVRVASNGSGIPEQERRALAGVEETALQHASGVGLWLVYWLVTGAGGRVEVEDGGGVVLHPDAGKN